MWTYVSQFDGFGCLRVEYDWISIRDIVYKESPAECKDVQIPAVIANQYHVGFIVMGSFE